MNESFIRDVYCGKVEFKALNKHEIKGWIAVNISDEKLAKYNGNNVKIIVNIIGDLGKDETVKKQ